MPYDKENRRERCEQCGRVWNVSVFARPYAGVYVCPICEKRNRKGKSIGREKAKDKNRKRIFKQNPKNRSDDPEALRRKVLVAGELI